MRRRHLHVTVKLWALASAITGITLVGDQRLTFLIALLGFLYLAYQRNFRFLGTAVISYSILTLLLGLIRHRGMRLVFISEFHVLMFWSIFPVCLVGWDLLTTPPGEISAFLSEIHMPSGVILGLLVMFRFFPVMKDELRSVRMSMKNRGLTEVWTIVAHPFLSAEYVLVPLLLRCLQIADQLSVSAVARGADSPGVRGSIDGRRFGMADAGFIAIWGIFIITLLVYGGKPS